MSEERPEHPERVDRVVHDLLRGRRLRLHPSDAADREEILMAARLLGSRDPRPHMSADFRRQLARQLADEHERHFPSRRAAMVAGLGLAVGAAAGVSMSQLARRPTATRVVVQRATPTPGTAKQDVIDPKPGRWTDVAGLDELIEGQPLRVSVGGAFNAYLVRQGDKVTALSSVCSHLPCELVWNARATQLACPCHNQSFDLRGQPVRETYPIPPLAVGRVQVANNRVQVMGP